jgi:hypothetical protein
MNLRCLGLLSDTCPDSLGVGGEGWGEEARVTITAYERKGADFRPRPASAYPRAPLLHVIVEERHFSF